MAAASACSAEGADGEGPRDGNGSPDDNIDLGGNGDGPSNGDAPDRPVGDFCDEFEVEFEPKTPTVYIVVDRSGSMFGAEDYWGKLKSGLLPIVEELQSDVRFGFASYTGETSDPSGCGLDSGVSIAANNFTSIESAWNTLGAPPKGETPTSQAIQQATERLLADPSPGGRFILLVSDGAPDLCNDIYNLCGVDATVASLQLAASQGVQTLVFGIETSSVDQDQFDVFAQAGIGEYPIAPSFQGQDIGVYGADNGTVANQCTSASIWPDLKASNEPARRNAGMVESSFEPAGAYSSTPGTASAFLTTDLTALAAQIRTSLAGLKSCQIALNFSVTNASTGQIYVDDTATPIPNEEWGLAEGEDDVIELKGASCELWQSEGVDYFFAGFPCGSIVR